MDCAEGTARQFSLQPHYNRPHVRLNKISKLFITHMHGVYKCLCHLSAISFQVKPITSWASSPYFEIFYFLLSQRLEHRISLQ